MKGFLRHIPLIGAIALALTQLASAPKDPNTYSTAAAIILAALSGGPKKQGH